MLTWGWVRPERAAAVALLPDRPPVGPPAADSTLAPTHGVRAPSPAAGLDPPSTATARDTAAARRRSTGDLRAPDDGAADTTRMTTTPGEGRAAGIATAATADAVAAGAAVTATTARRPPSRRPTLLRCHCAAVLLRRTIWLSELLVLPPLLTRPGTGPGGYDWSAGRRVLKRDQL